MGLSAATRWTLWGCFPQAESDLLARGRRPLGFDGPADVLVPRRLIERIPGKTAVVYGAGGIGGAIARALAREGGYVALAART